MKGVVGGEVGSMDLKDILTLLIALYGAGLSTCILWRSNRHLSIAIEPVFLAYPDGSVSTQGVSIKVVNVGSRPIGVTVPTIRLPNGKFLSFTDVEGLRNFPKRLEGGESAPIRTAMKKLADSVKAFGLSGKVKVRPCCYDTTGKRYLGKKFTIDTARDWKD
jgi:hypothetical protein